MRLSEEIRNAIKAYMVENDETWISLANKLGVGAHIVRAVVNGRSCPGTNLIARIGLLCNIEAINNCFRLSESGLMELSDSLVKKLRLKRIISNTDTIGKFSDFLNIHSNTYSKIEGSNKIPTLFIFIKIGYTLELEEITSLFEIDDINALEEA